MTRSSPLRKFLVPLDGSQTSGQILEVIERLIARQDVGVVDLLSVVPAWESDDAVAAAQVALGEARSRLSERGIPTAVHLLRGDAAEEILRLSQERQPDLVAMSTHGRSGVERWLRGSVAERVLRSSPAPLLLCNPRSALAAGQPFRRILVPLDGSERAAGVLPLARAIATTYGSELVLIHVGPLALPEEGGGLRPQLPEDLKRTLEPARAALEAAGYAVRALGACGDPAHQILRAVESEGIDLVALSSHGRTGAARWWFGSVAEAVLRQCPVPVLVQR